MDEFHETHVVFYRLDMGMAIRSRIDCGCRVQDAPPKNLARATGEIRTVLPIISDTGYIGIDSTVTRGAFDYF
jgi:hypothetical protein